jgi:hypothetical protein
MTKRIDAITRANKMAYGALCICLAFLFVKSHHTALSLAQPMASSLAYTASVTGWLRDERRLLILIFELAATPLVVFYGVLLCRSLASGRKALPSAFASALSMGALFAMSWSGPFAFFLLPLPLLSLVFSIVNLVKAPSLLLELSVLAEVITLVVLPCYALWFFAVFVD